MAGVPFVIHEFPTSPVPTVIMLGGPGVPGNLPEAVRAFPSAARPMPCSSSRPPGSTIAVMNRRSARTRPSSWLATSSLMPTAKTVTVPIRSEIDVDDYRQKTPTSLPGAQVGWTRKYRDRD